MAKVRGSSQKKKTVKRAIVPNKTALLERLNDRFPNFLLGLTVVVLAALVLSIIFQSKTVSQNPLTTKVASLFGLKKAESPTSSQPRTYTVQRGDTLWAIAESAYGSGYNAFDLAKANQILDPNQLNEGTVLELPALEPRTATQGELASGVFTTKEQAPQPPVAPKGPSRPSQSLRTYVIQSGDSLWMISMSVYGNPYRWTELWNSNPSITNPDLIYAGNTLTLP